MADKLAVGLKGRESVAVKKSVTAQAMDSGDLSVFATPALVALMEKTAAGSVRNALAPGSTSVGTKIQIEHVSATPEGGVVRCESELRVIDGRKLTFYVEAYDEAGLIGRGTHERFIVDREKFMAKAKAKLKR